MVMFDQMVGFGLPGQHCQMMLPRPGVLVAMSFQVLTSTQPALRVPSETVMGKMPYGLFGVEQTCSVTPGLVLLVFSVLPWKF